MDIFQKLDSLVRCSPMRQREPREGGIDLSQAVRSTGRDVPDALCVKAETWGVVRMFCQENRDQNGRIEKQLQLERPRICALPLPADAVERFIYNGNSNRLARTEHRYALFAH